MPTATFLRTGKLSWNAALAWFWFNVAERQFWNLRIPGIRGTLSFASAIFEQLTLATGGDPHRIDIVEDGKKPDAQCSRPHFSNAPLAQLDRASVYGTEG